VSALVAVTAQRRTDGDRERVAVNSAYIASLVRVGLEPLIVPPLLAPEDAGAVLDAVRGLMLTGGEDVEPARYGAPRHETVKRVDARRDALEAGLIAAARSRGRPILAICRGIQILNVALGGTLYQDLPSERPGPIDHTDEAARHPIAVAPDTLLARTLGAHAASVNSRHHQAVRDVASPLVAAAWAPDGVVEAVEAADGAGPWTLAIQWHPEDELEDAVFQGFARALG
jgi:putative glutamine amidotransferase